MLKNLKFIYKLIFFVLLVSLIPLLVISYIGYSSLNNTLNYEIYRNIDEIGRNKTEEINQWFYGKKIEADAMANAPILRNGIETKEERAEYTAYNWWRMQQRDKDVYDAEWSTDINGWCLIATPDDKGGVASIKEANVKDRAYFQPAISGKIVVSDPLISRSTGGLVVTTVAPTIGNNGECIGVLGNNILLTHISNNLRNIDLSENSFAVLVSQNGTYVVHPDEEMLITLENEEGKNVNIEQDELSKAIVKLMNNDSLDNIEIQFGGRKKLVSISNIPEVNWTLGIVADYDELFAERSNLINKYIIALVVVLVLILGVGYIIISSINKPLVVLKDAFKEASEGNLTNKLHIKSKDEFGILGQSYNTMIDNIAKLINEVKESAYTVISSSDSLVEITEEATASTNETVVTIEQIAQSSYEQAKDTENGVIKVGHLAEGIEKVAESSQKIKVLSDETSNLSLQGLEIVDKLTVKSQENSVAVSKVNDVILEVDRRAEEINKIINAIGIIAQQTNLLALNASIEAARAGDAGSGFAVVADEVRKLAEQSADASNEIKTLLEGIQHQSKAAVGAMSEAESIMNEQLNSVTETRGIFSKISSSIDTLTGNVIHVYKNSENMVEEKNKIVEVIESISAAAEETSAATTQVSQASENQLEYIEKIVNHSKELVDLGMKLQNNVERFKI